jgi:voltage-gated potassium channel
MRRRVYEILSQPRPDDRVGRLISGALLLLIAANVAASILETDAEIRRGAPAFFEGVEAVSVAIFTIEYLLRLWSCTADPQFAGAVRGRARIALTPLALIDLAAIVPSYLELLLTGTLDLRFLRVLRLLRLFRLLRYSRVADAFATMGRVLRGKQVELAVSLAIVLVAMLLAAGTAYVAERDAPGTQFTSIPRAMWWAVETITTIGYGDMIPMTPAGRVIGGIVAFIGICTVALPVGIVSSGFIEELNRKKQQTTATAETTAEGRSCPHCGSALED